MKKYDFIIIFFSWVGALSVLSNNWEMVRLDEAVAVLIGLSIFFWGLYMFFVKLLNNREKAFLSVVVLYISFFSFGHLFHWDGAIYKCLYSLKIGGVRIGQYRYLLCIWAVITFWLLYLVARMKKALFCMASIISIFTFVLLVLNGLIIIKKMLTPHQRDALLEQRFNHKKHSSCLKYLPNVYYIIFDQYGREDVLFNIHNLNTSAFIKALERRNFFVSKRSCSNYNNTSKSIPSSLNMGFFDVVQEGYRNVLAYFYRNRLVDFFEKQGYTTIHVASDAFGLSEKNPRFDYDIKTVFLGKFTLTVLYWTLMQPFYGWLNAYFHGNVIEKQFLILKNISKKFDGPYFVFCHILCPHDPYVFDDDGTIINGLETFAFYKKQVTYLNKRIIDLVDTILAQEKKRPLIVMHGDHGPSFRREKSEWEGEEEVERLGIFNAIYLPDKNESLIYQDITPVNIFRVLLNHYFGTSFDRLPDLCFYGKVMPIAQINNFLYNHLKQQKRIG